MQRDGAVLNVVLRIFLRVVSQSLQDHCARRTRRSAIGSPDGALT
jgi:hypothetical protein